MFIHTYPYAQVLASCSYDQTIRRTCHCHCHYHSRPHLISQTSAESLWFNTWRHWDAPGLLHDQTSHVHPACEGVNDKQAVNYKSRRYILLTANIHTYIRSFINLTDSCGARMLSASLSPSLPIYLSICLSVLVITPSVPITRNRKLRYQFPSSSP